MDEVVKSDRVLIEEVPTSVHYSDISDDEAVVVNQDEGAVTACKKDKRVRTVTQYFSICRQRKFFFRGDNIVGTHQFIRTNTYYEES